MGLGLADVHDSGPKQTREIGLVNDVGVDQDEMTDTEPGEELDEEAADACARHIWLVLEDARREINQPGDVEPVQAQGAVALAALGADHTSGVGGRPPSIRQPSDRGWDRS
jgi:hypothetical protein